MSFNTDETPVHAPPTLGGEAIADWENADVLDALKAAARSRGLRKFRVYLDDVEVSSSADLPSAFAEEQDWRIEPYDQVG